MPQKGKKKTVADYPEVAAQWHPEKNGDLSPDQVTAGKDEKYWWTCPKGPDHEWRARPTDRIRQQTGCPCCAGKQPSVTNSLASQFPEIAAQWHPGKNGDLTPDQVVAGSNRKFWWKCPKGPDHEWRVAPGKRTSPEKGCPACAGYQVSVTNSLASQFPEIAAQWHPEKNGDLSPDQVVAGSRKKRWWKCPKGSDHEWQAVVESRTRLSAGCPCCAGKQPSVTNSLASQFPEIAAQWHPEKNGDLTPDQVVAGSTKKRWWACTKGPDHEWQATVEGRARRGCPFCAGYQVSVTNSLACQFPEIAAQWHPEKNGDLSPDQVVAGSRKKRWWKCPKGSDHEWQAAVESRTRLSAGCPACAGYQVSVTNSLASQFPEVAAEWHPEKNDGVTPDQVVAGSNRKFWWKCPKGPDHEWQTTVVSRTGRQAGCPRCGKGWTLQAVRAFVESILGHLDALTPAELHLLFQQSGLLQATGKSKTFAKALATGRFPHEELEKFVHGEESLVDSFVSGEVENLGEVAAAEEVGELGPEEEAQITEEVETDSDLPVVQAKDALAALDFHVIASSDEEAVQFLVASATAKLWRHAYQDPGDAVRQATEFRGGDYAGEVRQAFLDEFAAATALEIPPGYDFRQDGELIGPNLMQRLVAVRIRENKRYGNWSGTGAGKTLSAVLATRVVGSELSVICCPNAVVDHWKNQIDNIFPGSVVATRTWEPKWSDGTSGPRYLVQNFEQFQQPDSEARIKGFCDRERVGFVIIDEIHVAKQRYAEQMSTRRRLVSGLVSAEGTDNPDLCVLGMSATPVINNLNEGKSLVEMITGLTHDELETRATVANCMRLHQRLVALGTRYKPPYQQQLVKHSIEVDCGEYIDEIRAVGKNHSPLDLEKILTRARLPVIVEHCERGDKVLVYTHYVEDIDEMLKDALVAKGLKVGLYTGDDKTGLDGFLHGDVDVLIGSSAIGTGVDGLQHVCSKVVINVLPWTNAEYEQLVGRIYRQGQKAQTVDVVIPTTFAMVGGERWSYCDSKLRRIEYKRSVADAAVDGAVPEGNLRTPAQAQRDLMAWLERLDHGETADVVRTRITVPLSDAEPADVKRRLAVYGDFSTMNRRWNVSKSETLAVRLAENPEEWEQYHTLYRQARESWTVVPYEEMIQWAQEREGLVIGDFGCGEALFGAAVCDRHTVHNFDHIGINGTVMAGDMAHTPLDDESLDSAVFCLSLMGANFSDYIREAHRTLRLDGLLHIWEATSRFDDPDGFARDLARFGFKTFSPEERGPFTYVEARKTERRPVEGAVLRFREVR